MTNYGFLLRFVLFHLVLLTTNCLSFGNDHLGGDINIRFNVPDIIKANQEILVTLEIEKADLQGPAIISQKFPTGFKGIALVSGDAEFRVDNQFVVITFTKMPTNPTFTISYTLKIGNLKPAVYPVSIDFYDPSLTKHSYNNLIKIEGIKTEANESVTKSHNPQNSSKVRVTLEHADSIIAGMSFPVKMTINKGNYSGEAKITQRVPPGFTISKPTNIPCEFSSASGEVSFSLSKMRPDPTFTIEYTVKIGTFAVGKYPITGVYTDGDGNHVDFNSVINVLNETKTQISKIGSKSQKSVSVELENFGAAIPGQEFEVKVKLHKDNYTGFGRLMQIFPIGLNPIQQEIEGIEFEVTGNIIKATWKSMPIDTVIELAYRISVASTAAGIYPVLGIFESSRGKIDLEHNIVVKIPGQNEMAKKADDLISAKKTEPEKKPAQVSKVQKPDSNPVSTSNLPDKSKEQANIQKPEAKEKSQNQTTTKPATNQSGIIYRVQVTISKEVMQQSVLEKKLSIKGPFFEYFDKGIYKYSVGEFTAKEPAQAFRKEVQLKGIKDAFVVSFKDGVRIQ